MIALPLSFLALAAWAMVATFVVVARDGYRRVPTSSTDSRPNQGHPGARMPRDACGGVGDDGSP